MSDSPEQDWDPRSPEVLDNQIVAYDAVRRRCPVAYSDYLNWSVFRHADVLRVLHDPHAFSSRASHHLSVPNGMDPPEHTIFRKLIDPYFNPAALARFEPTCREVVNTCLAGLEHDAPLEFMDRLAHPFALRIQCAFMGWSARRLASLEHWMKRKQQATLAGDSAALTTIVQEFDDQIRAVLAWRRQLGADAPDDVTTRLLNERVDGGMLTDEEIISILRNWTAGELGTIAAAVGILVEYLATHPALQDELRAQPALLPPAIDEILRIHSPLIANRRMTTCPVELGGRRIPAGQRVSVLWASANRDEAVFGDPDEFRIDRDPTLNLLYGAGIHVCPGAPLARMELHHLMEQLLAGTRAILPVPGQPSRRAAYPASGFTETWAVLA